MAFALIFWGLVLTIASVRGTTSELFGLLKGDLTGPDNYTVWIVAVILIGSLGYIPGLEKVSRAFLVLIIAVLVFGGAKLPGGLFTRLAGDVISGTSKITGGGTVPQTNNQPNRSFPPLPSLGSPGGIFSNGAN